MWFWSLDLTPVKLELLSPLTCLTREGNFVISCQGPFLHKRFFGLIDIYPSFTFPNTRQLPNSLLLASAPLNLQKTLVAYLNKIIDTTHIRAYV